MPLAKDVAAELRKLADCLDKSPEAEIKKPSVSFWHWDQRDQFISVAPLIPRPLKKVYSDDDLRLEHDNDALVVYASIRRKAICTIIEPAKPAVYDCPRILSDAEEAQIGA